MRQRVRGGRVGRGIEEAHTLLVAFIVFDLHRDPVHHRDRFLGPCTRRAFGREHHRVGSVIDRVGDVGDFGAGRRGAFDHAFEHLRRDDHRLACAARHADDLLLQRRHFVGLKLDAQIAARDHDAIGQFDDRIEPVDRLGLLDLGADRSAVGADQLTRLGNVLGTLHEAQGDPVRPVFGGEGEITAVLLGQRRDRHFGIGDVDALAVRDNPANFGAAQDAIVVGFEHLEADLAVIDQQPLAARHDPEQFGMRQADAAFIARRLVPVEHEVARMADYRLAILEGADPQFRPLQVGQDRDRLGILLFERTDRDDCRFVIGMRAVAHVEAESVRACAHQPVEHLGRTARRADRGENLDLAPARVDPWVLASCHGLAIPLVAGLWHSRFATQGKAVMNSNADPLDALDDAQAAAAFRRLVRHLRHRHDAQNIDLMGLAGFCRNCLADWIREAGYPGDKEAARELIHGMPSGEWKATRQSPATEEQMARMAASVARNAQE